MAQKVLPFSTLFIIQMILLLVLLIDGIRSAPIPSDSEDGGKVPMESSAMHTADLFRPLKELLATLERGVNQHKKRLLFIKIKYPNVIKTFVKFPLIKILFPQVCPSRQSIAARTKNALSGSIVEEENA
jgi:hypothetical protein